jgi:hypothetical protein
VGNFFFGKAVTSLLTSLLGFFQGLAIWAVETFLKDPLFASTMRYSKVKPVEEYMAYTEQRDAYAKLWYEEVGYISTL